MTSQRDSTCRAEHCKRLAPHWCLLSHAECLTLSETIAALLQEKLWHYLRVIIVRMEACDQYSLVRQQQTHTHIHSCKHPALGPVCPCLISWAENNHQTSLFRISWWSVIGDWLLLIGIWEMWLTKGKKPDNPKSRGLAQSQSGHMLSCFSLSPPCLCTLQWNPMSQPKPLQLRDQLFVLEMFSKWDT